METTNIFLESFLQKIKEPVTRVLLESGLVTIEKDLTPEVVNDEKKASEVENDKKLLTCSYCKVNFTDAQTHRLHYKLDWHRYNLKQSLLTKEPITEKEFDKKTENDDLSSISGSDSEKEDAPDIYATALGKIFLKNHLGMVFSIYSCLLFNKKEDIEDEILQNKLNQCVLTNQKWTVLMLGGGHFAGAIFQGTKPILHKTFHCYTVRAGQGGSQSAKDGKSGGSQPKSAGASLRRYNEQALIQHIRKIVELWKSDLAESSLIFYRASGSCNRSVLFGGNDPLLERNDSRLRTIPISTRRATFSEVQRVHKIISSVQIYESLEKALEMISKERPLSADSKRTKVRLSNVNRAKSREPTERPLPAVENDLDEQRTRKLDWNLIQNDSDGQLSSDTVENLSLVDSELPLEHLKEFDDSLSPKDRKKLSHKKKKPKKSASKKLRELEEARKKETVEVLIKGNVEKLRQLMDNHLKTSKNEENAEKVRLEFVNEVLDEDFNTPLHMAGLNEHREILRFLLNNDADPCLKNKNQQTAYSCTQSREIREELKIFAKENPEKFNYNKAQIPTNALSVEEQAEKRKLQKKIKKEKEKEKKKEQDLKRREDADKNRFLNLSDREKRALAAEKRILSQAGVVIAKCFLCGQDMAGQVPFEYLNNRFCTMDCLKAHRMKSPLVLS